MTPTYKHFIQVKGEVCYRQRIKNIKPTLFFLAYAYWSDIATLAQPIVCVWDGANWMCYIFAIFAFKAKCLNCRSYSSSNVCSVNNSRMSRSSDWHLYYALCPTNKTHEGPEWPEQKNTSQTKIIFFHLQLPPVWTLPQIFALKEAHIRSWDTCIQTSIHPHMRKSLTLLFYPSPSLF